MSDDVKNWLEKFGLGKYAEVLSENEIDFRALPLLSEDDMKELGLPLGARRNLQAALEQLPKEATKPQTTEQGERTTSGEAERRQLTVMFCDLVGSTVLAERLDPEELRELLAEYQETCAEVVRHFDGYIARYVGDGLLMYFGYPQAHEDDPQRAVRAGLSIVESIQALSRSAGSDACALSVRIGVATGVVVAGDIGSGDRRDEDAIVGETPNLAARLQGLAEPNTVVISSSTQRLVEGLFDCDDLGHHHVKGISESVRAYCVREETDIPSRFEALAKHGLTPLVGRDAEITLLTDRWHQALDGDSQVLLLTGEAGIGKSRIVRSFMDQLIDEAPTRILCYCSPFHQNSALYPVINQLERAMRFRKEDTESQKVDKIKKILCGLELPIETCTPFLVHLLSLTSPGRYTEPALSPQELKNKTLETYISIVKAMAFQQTVLMVVEDIHWIDASTLALIELLIEQLTSARFLLLITARAEFKAPWSGITNFTSLSLNRLGNKGSLDIIDKTTKGKRLPDEVLNEIVAKTDGVPLFIEELTKSLIESNLLTAEENQYVLKDRLSTLTIPASLQDSLMARLDRLGPVKEVAQLAAMLGRRFSYELIAAVSPLNEPELKEALTQLIQAELIYQHGLPPDITYEFKHALVQDVAYQSLLKSKRAQFHEQIAMILEERFPAICDTEPEVLARHFAATSFVDKTIHYLQQAGELATKHSADIEAVNHFTRALEELTSLPKSADRDRQELKLLIHLGPAIAATQGYASKDFAKTYERARVLCDELGDIEQQFPVVWGLWFAKNQTGRIQEACMLADELLKIGKQQTDSGILLEAHHSAWTSNFAGGVLTKVLEHAKEGRELYDIDQHGAQALTYGGHDPGVCSRIMGAMALCLLGFIDQARDWAEESIPLAERIDHKPSLAVALSFSTTVYFLRREPGVVEKYTDSLTTLCADHGFALFGAMASILHGWSLAQQNDAERGMEELQAGLDALRATGMQRLSFQLMVLADACNFVEQTEKGLEVVKEALQVVDETNEERWAPDIYRLKGELLTRSTGDEADAKASFNQAIELSQRQEAKLFELRAATSLGKLLQDQGKIQTARELVSDIYRQFSEGFSTSDLQKAKSLLEQLS